MLKFEFCLHLRQTVFSNVRLDFCNFPEPNFTRLKVPEITQTPISPIQKQFFPQLNYPHRQRSHNSNKSSPTVADNSISLFRVPYLSAGVFTFVYRKRDGFPKRPINHGRRARVVTLWQRKCQQTTNQLPGRKTVPFLRSLTWSHCRQQQISINCHAYLIFRSSSIDSSQGRRGSSRPPEKWSTSNGFKHPSEGLSIASWVECYLWKTGGWFTSSYGERTFFGIRNGNVSYSRKIIISMDGAFVLLG